MYVFNFYHKFVTLNKIPKEFYIFKLGLALILGMM